MDSVALPSGLQSLTLDDLFNQSMNNVALLGGWQSSTFDDLFIESMDNVACRSVTTSMPSQSLGTPSMSEQHLVTEWRYAEIDIGAHPSNLL